MMPKQKDKLILLASITKNVITLVSVILVDIKSCAYCKENFMSSYPSSSSSSRQPALLHIKMHSAHTKTQASAIYLMLDQRIL